MSDKTKCPVPEQIKAMSPEELLKQFERLKFRAAKRFIKTVERLVWIDAEDVYQVADIALLKAQQTYEPTEEASFMTYAYRFIEWEIMKALKIRCDGNGYKIEPITVSLDEPINGLDPIGISELRETFRKLNEERGITLIISSHILSELYAVANRFLFIENGRVLKEVSKDELDLECSRCIVVRSDDTKRGAMMIEDKLGINDYKVIDDREIRIYSPNVSSVDVNRMLVSGGLNVSEIFESGVSLEDYFKQLVGEVS